MAPTVLVTRPAEQAHAWVRQLAAQGVQALALPLIGIAPATDAAAVDAAWHGVGRRALVVFVSPNAALHFFARRPAGAAWPERVLAGSPGPGTSAALRRLGVPDAAIVAPAADSAQFDSETLWAALQPLRPWRGASVLLVRGSGEHLSEADAEADAQRDAGSGRDWLSVTLRAAGAEVQAVAAYRRGAPQWSADECALARAALAAPAQHLWLLSSSEAVGHLLPLAAQVAAAPVDWAQAQALATHPRIAERAQRAGFGRVIRTAPTVAAVAAAVLGGGASGAAPMGQAGGTPSIESGAT